jgi:hypothetical protein
MKLVCAIALMAASCSLAAAQTIPLPRPRPLPSAPVPEPSVPAEPSACRLRLTPEIATAPSLPPMSGPGECGAPDVVRLEAIHLPDHSSVAVAPPAILRCTMAEAVASWVREEAAPRVQALGSALRSVQTVASYDCRSQNNIKGAKLSEHGRANALDMHALKLADGKALVLTDPRVDKEFREGLRHSVCARFMTVLGPGSDGYHEEHVHIDLAERRGGYRLCEWDVREPGEPAQATVPLPRPRPAIEDGPDSPYGLRLRRKQD